MNRISLDLILANHTVQVRGTVGTIQRTVQTMSDGSFAISGLSVRNYRLVVSNPGLKPTRFW